MHNCVACSMFDTKRARPRRKRPLSLCMKNRNKLQYIKEIQFQSIGELTVVLDPTIVDKYLKAKKTIDAILRPSESIGYQESYLDGSQKLNFKNYDESFYNFCTPSWSKASTETTSTSNLIDFSKKASYPSVSIKDEILSVAFYDEENNLINDPDMQIIEIPANSNIVLNPMNNCVTFSQFEPTLNNSNKADANVFDPQQSTEPKYLYNPMNNVVTSSQGNNASDENNNDQPNAMPADVQFEPGEYTMEDSFLNENYNVINTFALEPADMDSNQNALLLKEQNTKEQSLNKQLVDSMINFNTNEEADWQKGENMELLKDLISSSTNDQEITLDNGDDKELKVGTESEEGSCAKCHKKFKVLHYLRKHELTCGITFKYNCLFCSKSSMLSHTIKCHMSNCHVEYVAIYGMKELMERVIKTRKENKVFSEAKMNSTKRKEHKIFPEVDNTLVSMDDPEKYKKNDKRKQVYPKRRDDYTVEVKKAMCERNLSEELVFANLQTIYGCKKELSEDSDFKPSKVYVDAFCSNCSAYFKKVKSGARKSCSTCQIPLIFKCAVCRKCFSKYLSICGHVKYHPPTNLIHTSSFDIGLYCGYCNYETVNKSHLFRHLMVHTQSKSIKVKRENSG